MGINTTNIIDNKHKRKYLVLGANGMAGHVIFRYLHERGHEVAGYARKEVEGMNTIIGNIESEINSLSEITKKYDVIINAIGVLNDSAENNRATAVLLNAYMPHYLAEISLKKKNKVIYLSTDCVFSGDTGGYNETAFKDGKTFYDRSKALGEIDDNANLTLRNSIVGPDLNKDKNGLFNWFMRQNGQIQGYSRAIWTGVTTIQLAKGIVQAVEDGVTGIFHYVNNKTISKFELLLLFKKYMNLNNIEIAPCEVPCIDKSLICTRKDWRPRIPDYDEMIYEMREWIYNHKKLYLHYFREKKDIL